MQNSRYQKVEKFYEIPVFVAVVLLIPVIIIEYRSSGLKEFANYLNWGIWIVFLLEYVHLLILSENKKDYVLNHKLELFIVVGSIPFVPQGLESSRFLRFVRLPRLLRVLQLFRLAVVVAKFGADIKAIFNSRGLRSIVYATIFLIIFFGFLFFVSEPEVETFSDGIWWALVTITTVGYGDITPYTTLGRIERYINANTKGIKEGGIASFDEGGPVKNIDLDPAEIFKKIMMEGYRPSQEEKDALDKYLADKESKKAGGIMSLQMGGRASNMPIESVEASTAKEMEMIPPPMGTPSITPREMFQPMMMAKDGALVDKLPSKTNTDENNTANYKRTSGKLVVDASGKGNEEKDTMLAQLADGEFVTKSKAVRGAGIAMGANPKDKQEQRTLGARFFYKQMADFDKLAKRMSS